MQEIEQRPHYTVWENDGTPRNAYRCRRCGHFSLVPDVRAETAPAVPSSTEPAQEAHDCCDCAHWHRYPPDMLGVCSELNLLTVGQHGGCIDHYKPRRACND